MNKHLVLTIAVGDVYEKMAEYTHPSIKAYAEKIGADFICIDKNSCSTPHWEKFNAIYNYLNKYDRILYIDTDTLIRKDCPDIFAAVPKDKLAIFNEMPWTNGRQYSLFEACKEYGIEIPKWDGRYFNTGVMVIPRHFKHLFKKPEKESFNFYEQGYLNAILSQFLERSGNEHSIFELPYKFNRMTCMDGFTGEERHASYILHYAGYPSLEFVISIIKMDIEKWEKDYPNYNYKRHILVNVQGGLGDQICAEPAIRFMKKRVYPDEDINVITHWPELFRHLDVSVFSHDEFRMKKDTPYYHTHSLPGPDTVTWNVVSHLLCHSVDYTAISLLRRILPIDEKRIKLATSPEDLSEVVETIGITNLSDLVLVHPGRHWESKTFPVKWWQGVLDGLQEKGLKVCIIGQEEETRGTVNVVVREGVIDTRNLLSVRGLISLISVANVLVTNDSAPLHIAGAFDNGIVLIPTCKHHDHILPFRYGTQKYRAVALYKKEMSYEYDSRPTTVSGSSAHYLPGKWEEYLPDVNDVVSAVVKSKSGVSLNNIVVQVS